MAKRVAVKQHTNQDVSAEQKSAGGKEERTLQWYIAQYSGLVIATMGIALLIGFYDTGMMDNMYLTYLSLAIIVVGWIAHEFRPYNRMALISEHQTAAAGKEQ